MLPVITGTTNLPVSDPGGCGKSVSSSCISVENWPGTSQPRGIMCYSMRFDAQSA